MRLTRLETSGLAFAFLGVFFFSLSLTMTKWALESFDPFFTATFRPVIASAIAIPFLILFRVPRIPRQYFRSIIYVTLGTGIIWPVFIALALARTTSAHVAVIAAIMPLVTAIFSVMKNDTAVSLQFWFASSCGTILLILFAISRGGGTGRDLQADLFTVIAVIASAYCYVEGAELSKAMPGWQVISWVVIFALPVCIPASVFIWLHTHNAHPLTFHGVAGMTMIGVFSMYIGFFAWFRGLRDAGTTHGSQVQQLQAIMTLGWAALILHEKVTAVMVLIALGVVASVLWALSTRQRVLERS